MTYDILKTIMLTEVKWYQIFVASIYAIGITVCPAVTAAMLLFAGCFVYGVLRNTEETLDLIAEQLREELMK